MKARENYSLLGRIIAIAFAASIVFAYVTYLSFSQPYCGPYCRLDELFFGLIVGFTVAILVGPLVGQAYRFLEEKLA